MFDRFRAFRCISVTVALWAVVLCFPSVACGAPFLSSDIENALSAKADILRVFDLANNSNADELFEQAIDAAADDPGALWLLAVSFIRNDKLDQAIEAFTALERNILAGGATSAPFLSMQLMLLGNEEALRSQNKRAEFCYRWARRFDKNQCWWVYRRGAIDFPANVASAIPNFIAESIDILKKSWRAQLALAAGAHRYLSATVFIFICAVMFVFAIKYLPSGVHNMSDVLFGGASPQFKVISGVIIAISTLFLGVVPGLWVVAFFVFRFVTGSEKKLLFLVCVLLTLAPLNAYVTQFITRHAEPSSPAVLLDRAITEGYSSDLHKQIAESVQKNPGNHANQLSLAVSAAKNRNYTVAESAVNRALQIAPDDHMTLLYAGNIAFLSDKEDGMIKHYNELLKLRPQSAEAKFNLSLAYADKGGFTSVDMMGEAAQIDPELIGGFLRENERYFPDGIPRLRRIIQRPISPAYFWTRLFTADVMETFAPGKTSFGGMNPMTAFAACAAVLILLLTLNATAWSNSKTKAKPYFVCRICGRLLCRKCRRGTLCGACYKISLDSHNNAAAMYNLQRKHLDRAIYRKDFLRFVTGIIVPGADKLYIGETAGKPAMKMFLASAIFAAVYCALTFNTYYPASTAIKPIYFVSILLIYNLVMLIKQLKWLSSTLKMRAKTVTRTL